MRLTCHQVAVPNQPSIVLHVKEYVKANKKQSLSTEWLRTPQACAHAKEQTYHVGGLFLETGSSNHATVPLTRFSCIPLQDVVAMSAVLRMPFSIGASVQADLERLPLVGWSPSRGHCYQILCAIRLGPIARRLEAIAIRSQVISGHLRSSQVSCAQRNPEGA